jgi:hypothetical protein
MQGGIMMADAPRSRVVTGTGDPRADDFSPFTRLPAMSLQAARGAATDEVQRLVDELEPTLDAYQRRLLHQVRLAAESLGAIGAASLLRGQR